MKKIIACIIALLLIFSITSAFAEEPITEEPIVEEEVITEEEPVIEEEPIVEEPIVEEEPPVVEEEPIIEEETAPEPVIEEEIADVVEEAEEENTEDVIEETLDDVVEDEVEESVENEEELIEEVLTEEEVKKQIDDGHYIELILKQHPNALGDVVIFEAILHNYAPGHIVDIIWEYSEDDEHWHEIEDEHELTYEFIVTRENMLYWYRVTVVYKYDVGDENDGAA